MPEIQLLAFWLFLQNNKGRYLYDQKLKAANGE
jgi:hypothetical protein